MARNLTAGWIAQATASNSRPVVFFEAVFATSTLRLWNGAGDISWNAQTWIGNGWFQGPEGMEETVDLEATDMAIVLSGVPSSVIALVIGDQKQGATGKLWLGFLDSSGAVVAEPYLVWSGLYSHAEVAEAAAQSTATLFYDSPLVDLERPKEGRWTHEGQQRLFPGDLGFEYVKAAANWDGTWGQGAKKKADRKRPPKGTPRKR